MTPNATDLQALIASTSESLFDHIMLIDSCYANY